ncbi:PEP-CTERM putative exosortase interaction domain-containing protein [Burkholderiales bacterium JOSHI_001]|nr:PEP-CTERM putative exosortase interaction domain-containing protein [Burkholderiales bacterium JOSHI_001]
MKKPVLAAFLAMSALGAMAADQTVSFTGANASFASTGPLLSGGDDVLSFDNLAAGLYDVTLTLSSQYTTPLVVTLNSNVVPEVFNLFGVIRFFGLQTSDTSPFTLTLAGSATTPALANYAGTLSVVPVPEPETYAMLLAGLGAMGFMLRRRSKP